MNPFLSESLINGIGWTLLHSLWQGLLFAMLMSSVLLLIPQRRSGLRYTVAISALILFAGISAKTFLMVYQPEEAAAGKNQQQVTVSTVLPDLSESSQMEQDEYSVLEKTAAFIKTEYGKNISIAVSIWMLGVIIFGLKFAGGFAYSRRLKKSFEKADHRSKSLFRKLTDQLNISENVEIGESRLVKTPLTIGFFKPLVLFPAGMIAGIPGDQLEAILLHELAHIKRKDYLVNILQSFAEVIFFFNPAVWWMSNKIREEREHVCDDIAAEYCGDKLSLMKALSTVNQSGFAESNFALTFGRNKNNIYRRIKRMTGTNDNPNGRMAVLTLLTILLTAIIAFSCTSTEKSVNQEMQDDEKNETVIVKKDNTDKDSIEVVERKFQFKRYEDGEQSEFEVTLDAKNNIVQFFKDGEEVPESEYDKYEDIIPDKVVHGKKERDKVYSWNFNDEEFEKNMEGLKENLKKIKIRIDSNLVSAEIAHLNDELSQLKDMEFFSEEDRKKLKEEIKQLKEELKELKVLKHKVKVKIDREKLEEEMKKVRESVKDIEIEVDDIDLPDIDIDIPDIDVDLRGLKEDLKNLDIDLSGIKAELKSLKDFLHELKLELKSEGLLESDEEVDLRINDDEMLVNGEKVSDELHQKYLNLLDKHSIERNDDENEFHLKFNH